MPKTSKSDIKTTSFFHIHTTWERRRYSYHLFWLPYEAGCKLRSASPLGFSFRRQLPVRLTLNEFSFTLQPQYDTTGRSRCQWVRRSFFACFVPASMIGYTQGSEGGAPSRCQEKGGDFRTLEKILPDLDSGARGIIIYESAWTYLSAQAFVHLIRSSGCSES